MRSSSCSTTGRRSPGMNGPRPGSVAWPSALRCDRSVGSALGARSTRASAARRPSPLAVRCSRRGPTFARLAAGGDRAPLLRGSASRRGRDDAWLLGADGAGPSPSRSEAPAAAPGRGRRCRLSNVCARSSCRRPPRSSPMSTDSLAPSRQAPDGERHRGVVAARRCGDRRRRDHPALPERPEHGVGLDQARRSRQPWRIGFSLDARPLPADRGDLHRDARSGQRHCERGRGGWVLDDAARCPPASWSCPRRLHSCRAPTACWGTPSPSTGDGFRTDLLYGNGDCSSSVGNYVWNLAGWPI